MDTKINFGHYNEIELLKDTIKLRKGISYYTYPLEQLEIVSIKEQNDKKGWLYIKSVNDRKIIKFFYTNLELKESSHKLYNHLMPYTQRLIVDESNKSITIYQKSKDKTSPITLSFNQIKDYELLKVEYKYLSYAHSDYFAIDSKTSSISKMLMYNGNAAVKELKIKLYLNSYDEDFIYISYYQQLNDYSDLFTKHILDQCQHDITLLDKICEFNNKSNPKKLETNQNLYSPIPIEELKKLKELLDMDIITQEEFDSKKKQLLGL